jgi:hypothetical protein
MVNVEKHTSGVGVAATRREKVAMIVEVKAMNRMFAILTLSFIHASFYSLSIHALIIYFHIEDSI